MQVGLVPEKLSFLGTDFRNWEDKSLIIVVICVNGFYLASFIVSAISDYFALKMRIFGADMMDDALYEQLLQREIDNELTEQDKILMYRLRSHAWIFKASNWVLGFRLIVEFILPVVFSLYSIIVMGLYVSRT